MGNGLPVVWMEREDCVCGLAELEIKSYMSWWGLQTCGGRGVGPKESGSESGGDWGRDEFPQFVSDNDRLPNVYPNHIVCGYSESFHRQKPMETLSTIYHCIPTECQQPMQLSLECHPVGWLLIKAEFGIQSTVNCGHRQEFTSFTSAESQHKNLLLSLTQDCALEQH